MKSNYERGVDGPKIIGPNQLRRAYSQVKQIHGKWGTLLHES